MRTLLIDNYDSFTYNLFHELAEVTGSEPVVLRNDDPAWRVSMPAEFDNVVLSPGPGNPLTDGDFGLCAELVRHCTLPLLGVCLGHQGIAAWYGAHVERAPSPWHGRRSTVFHNGSELFDGIPPAFEAVRYHSLHVRELPEDLEATAWTADGTLMGFRHRDKPLWGVQFHPESWCTEYGRTLLANFAAQTGARESRAPEHASAPEPRPERELELLVRTVPGGIEAESAFERLFGAREHNFWLDSSKTDAELGRFSVMGAGCGELARVASADVASGTVTVRSTGESQVLAESFLDWIDRDMRSIRLRAPELPFDFALGWVGYLGYELKAQCGGAAVHRAEEPDAHMVFVDRALVLDHRTDTGYLLALAEPGAESQAWSWLDEAEQALRQPLEQGAEPAPSIELEPLRLRHDRTEYLRMIAECGRLIEAGETYEVCLTNMAEAAGEFDAWPAYRRLRRDHPAPFAAWLGFGELRVLSTSPERFLCVDAEGGVQARPIKGTRPRGRTPEQDAALRAELATSVKDHAENLMIVDLVRNDLGRCAEIGSVDASESFRVESYATVHQLVSTVRARLRAGASARDCVRAAFPGGSMTGAPKIRTMGVIDELEAGPRGVYSGAIGYFSLSGAADFNIAIRTLVHDGRRVRYGIGGAIVALSDPDEEFEETAVKAAPLLNLAGQSFPGREPLAK